MLNCCNRFLLVIALLCAGLCISPSPVRAEGVRVELSEEKTVTVPADWGHPAGHRAVIRTLSLSNKDITYQFTYKVCVSAEQHGGKDCVPFGEDCGLGMTKPSYANWFGGGMLSGIPIGADNIANRKASFNISEQGERDGAQITWACTDSKVTLDVMMLPDSSYLYLKLSTIPAIPLKQATLTCFPCSFARTRAITTADAVVQNKSGEWVNKLFKAGTLPAYWWVYYADSTADFAKDPKSSGPCSLVVLPQDLNVVNIANGYAVSTVLIIKGTTVRFAINEMPKTSNEDGLAEIRAGAAKTADNLLLLFPDTRNDGAEAPGK